MIHYPPMSDNRMRVFALVVLTSMNLVNYLDRFIISALLPYIKADLHLSDAQLGLLHTAFTFSYLFSAPFLGYLGDRISRKWLASFAVFFWSVATALSGMAGNYGALLGIRAMVGIGEAGYGPVAPTMISDFYSAHVRSRMLSIYYVGTPLGSAARIDAGWNAWPSLWMAACFPGRGDSRFSAGGSGHDDP